MSELSEAVVHDYPLEFLRDMVAFFNSCREDAVDDFGVADLINIYNCFLRCGWYIYPDQWTLKQISDAKVGICPDWDDDERPVYAADRRETRRIPYVRVKETANAND